MKLLDTDVFIDIVLRPATRPSGLACLTLAR